MNKVRIKTRRTESFEVDVPLDADCMSVAELRNSLLDYCVEKTGAERAEINSHILFDHKNSKFVFVSSETILG